MRRLADRRRRREQGPPVVRSGRQSGQLCGACGSLQEKSWPRGSGHDRHGYRALRRAGSGGCSNAPACCDRGVSSPPARGAGRHLVISPDSRGGPARDPFCGAERGPPPSFCTTERGSRGDRRPAAQGPVVSVSRPVGGILFPGPLRGSRSVTIHLCGLPVGASASRGRLAADGAARAHCSALLRVGVTEPPRSLPTLVRSYRTVSPLPVPHLRGGPAIGGLLSVALFRQIAPTWLSPAPCPAESRPSSTRTRRPGPRSPDRLTDPTSLAPSPRGRQPID